MEAEGYLRRYLERVPDSAPGHLALASLYDETLGNPTSALYHYEEYLRLVPEDAADGPRSSITGSWFAPNC